MPATRINGPTLPGGGIMPTVSGIAAAPADDEAASLLDYIRDADQAVAELCCIWPVNSRRLNSRPGHKANKVRLVLTVRTEQRARRVPRVKPGQRDRPDLKAFPVPTASTGSKAQRGRPAVTRQRPRTPSDLISWNAAR